MSLSDPPRRDFSSAQLKLIRRTLARPCTDAEFDEFIAVATTAGLDPMRRHITPLIVNAHDPDKRRLIPWTTIDGLRVIAARSGDYRPMEDAPAITFDEQHIDQRKNPLGIVRAEVRVWRKHNGEWFAVTGEAWWDEYAPLRAGQDGASLEEGGVLDPAWARMGRVMIAKCAEAQALRRGWPNLLSGLYSDEELQSLRFSEQTATERLHQRDLDASARTGEPTVWIAFDPADGLQAIPKSELPDRLRAHYRAQKSAAAVEDFNKRNRQSLQVFWSWSPGEALEIKRFAEERFARLRKKLARRKRGAALAQTGSIAAAGEQSQ